MQLFDALLGSSSKTKKNLLRQKFLIFLKVELSGSNVFLEIELFNQSLKTKKIHFEIQIHLYFRKIKLEKTCFISSKENCSYILGKEIPKNLFIFQERELSYISRRTSKALKTKMSYISPKKAINKFSKNTLG